MSQILRRYSEESYFYYEFYDLDKNLDGQVATTLDFRVNCFNSESAGCKIPKK